MVAADFVGVGNHNILADSVHKGSVRKDSVLERSTAVPPSLKKQTNKVTKIMLQVR